MTPPRAILFDLDGTLVATRRLYFEAFARALEPHVGYRMAEEEMIAYRPRSERRFLREVVGDDGAYEDCLEAFYEAYERLHGSHFQGVYPGVPEMLGDLRRREVAVGLVTGKSRRAWEVTCRGASLGPFDTLVFDDDVPRQKPDPGGIRLALERLGTSPQEAAYVGDSVTDLEAARAAGVLPVAVLWPKREEEVESYRREARKRGAVLLEHPEGLPRALEAGAAGPWPAGGLRGRAEAEADTGGG